MSNLIKSRHVYTDGNKKFIDTNELSEKLRVYQFEKVLTFEDEFAASEENDEYEENGFKVGLSVTPVETVNEKKSAEIYEEIIAKANEDAVLIIENAKRDAEHISRQLYEEAKKRGFNEGLVEGQKEIAIEKENLVAKSNELDQQYEEEVQGLENKFAELVTLYVEKLTGICVDDSKDVIAYLIHNSIIGMEPSKSLSIRVSKEDYEEVLMKLPDFKVYLSNDTKMEVRLDNELEKNHCFIDTDTCIINCSLDVTLNGLIRDIRLLSTQKMQ